MTGSYRIPTVIGGSATDETAAEANSRSDVVVMKFGGTSVADADRIRRVAERAVAASAAGSRVVVVASAMGKSTDQLIELAGEVSTGSHEREMDMLLSVGERISCALIAMAIQDLGHASLSLTGSQAGIVTDNTHGSAKIVEIRAHRLLEALDTGAIVLVAGFQGVSLNKDVTTLGRGGSDATAVALAAALGARACEIYTDVDGVYTADPRVVADAKKLHFVSYEEMLEMSGNGARVLMLRSVEFARNYDVPLHVRSSFSDEGGTWVGKEDRRMEQAIISGVVHDDSEALVTIDGVDDSAQTIAAVFAALAEAGVNIDLLLRSPSGNGTGTVTFSTPEADLATAGPVLDRLVPEIRASGWVADRNIGSVSLVGAGMRTHPGVASQMFSALAEHGIESLAVTTSPIRLTSFVPADRVEDAARVLHASFNIDALAGGRADHAAAT